jgi:hypothetical protein
MKSQSPQELWQAKLKAKDPFDPKDLLAPPNPGDAARASDTQAPARAAKANGTGLLLDITA